jgi:hypothetical protein
MEDPTVYNSQKVAHRVEYRLNALLSRVGRLFELFQPVNDLIEDFALLNPKETKCHMMSQCVTSLSFLKGEIH